MNHRIHYQTKICNSAQNQLEIRQVSAPLPPQLAWEVESFLLNIFEYGDYSFRSALRGEMLPKLCCTFFVAAIQKRIIAVAGCLYPRSDRRVALLGPVAVADNFRRQKLGIRLVKEVLNYLAAHGCQAVYLGVAENNPARKLYSKLGFERYCGIVMRHLFCPVDKLESTYYAPCHDTKIRGICWQDFCGVQMLLACPVKMYSFDFQQGLFSSRYSPPSRFLAVFPDMMKKKMKGEGLANVLVAGQKENVLGIAHVTRSIAKPLRHVATLDFFVHDNFIRDTQKLLAETIEQCRRLGIEIINCYICEGDRLKRRLIEKLGGSQEAILTNHFFIHGRYENVLIYTHRV